MTATCMHWEFSTYLTSCILITYNTRLLVHTELAVYIMWLALPQPTTYAHNVIGCGYHHQSIAPSMSELITTIPLTNFGWSAFSEACLISEACQASMSAWVSSINALYYLLVNVQAEITIKFLVDEAMDLATYILLTFWSWVRWGFNLGHITLSFTITHHFVAPHHPYISASSVDKSYRKW